MNKASRSDYSYHVRRDGERPVIVIVDLNVGGMSVTNNIDAVVEDVCESTGLMPGEAEIIYRDSDGIYDGVFESGGAGSFRCSIYALARLRRIADENEAVAAALADKPQW